MAKSETIEWKREWEMEKSGVEKQHPLRNLLLSKHNFYLVDIIQDGAQPIDIPTVTIFIRDWSAHVGAVQRRDEGDVLPVLALKLLIVGVFWWLIAENISFYYLGIFIGMFKL